MADLFVFYREEESEGASAPLAYAPLEAALAAFIDSDVPLAVEVVFVDEETIRTLNREQRQVDAVTDVLSFPALPLAAGAPLRRKDFPFDIDENGNLLLGSVVICVKRAREQAEEYGHSFRREIAFLTVHSLLHLLGYDHVDNPEGERQMRTKQNEILNKLGVTRD